MTVVKLAALVALEKGAKSDGEKYLTAAYHGIQRAGLFNGLSRTYQPKDDEGDRLPAESTLNQLNSRSLFDEMAGAVGRMLNVCATKDRANALATADVVVDGETIATKVPAVTLIAWEKVLDHLRTFVEKLPLLDPTEVWTWDDQQQVFRSQPTQTVRTKKVPRNHVKAEATDKHPAQVEVYYEDILVGTWTQTKFSAAVSRQQAAALRRRVQALLNAVRVARETANSAVVDGFSDDGDSLLSYIKQGFDD